MRDLRAFQRNSSVEWMFGLPGGQDCVDAILVFGGDGTVHRHLGALVKLDVPVLVVPAGSGNDFARSLEIRKKRRALTAWKRFVAGQRNCRTIDLGLIECVGSGPLEKKGIYFSCVAGVGLDGEISQRANVLPRWLKGRGGYALSLPVALAKFQPFTIKLCADRPTDGAPRHPRIEQPVMAAVFANTPFYGGGMKVAPRARMDDGLLEVCLIRAISKLKLLSVFPSVYFGRHLGISEVEYFSALSVRVETDRPLGVYADGEYVCETPIQIRAARNALRVIVP